MTTHNWRESAACRGSVTSAEDPFHAPDGEQRGSRAHKAREARALAICGTCPAVAFCYRAGLADPDQYVHAIFGGTTPADRGMSGVQSARRMLAYFADRDQTEVSA